MEHAKALRPEQLYRRCNPDDFPFTTIAELADLGEIIGKARTLEAIRFGIGITNSGYNIYAFGPPGVGKHSISTQRLSGYRKGDLPPDWGYVNNFDDPQRPVAIAWPLRAGRIFRDDMAHLIDQVAAPDAESFCRRCEQVRHCVGELPWSRRQVRVRPRRAAARAPAGVGGDAGCGHPRGGTRRGLPPPTEDGAASPLLVK